MEDAELEQILKEIRCEYQVPPYFPDDALKNFVLEGEIYLCSLNPFCDKNNDLTYRSLLKNYVYYAIHHNVDDFHRNYASMILTWQLTTEIPKEQEGETGE